jgi:hypothetical protein
VIYVPKKTLAWFIVLALFLTFSIVILYFAICVVDSSSEGWVRTYGGTNLESAYSIIQTSDGGYAVAGSVESGALLLKTDSTGNMEWNQTYVGDGARSLVGTSDGGYVLAGGTRLIKTDAYGNIEWTRTLLGGNSAYSLIQTSDKGYVVAGNTGDARYGEDEYFWLIKTDKLGYNQWSKTFETLMPGVARSVIQTSDGGYALLGSNSDNPDFLLVKTSSSGELEWSKTYGGEDNDNGWSIVQTSDGGYALAGMLWNRSDHDNMAGLIKINSEGNTLWMKNYPGFTPLSMETTIDGGYVLCSELTLVKTDSEGQLLWTKSINFADDAAVDQAHSVIQTLDGGYAIAGVGSPLYSAGRPLGDSQVSYAWIIKTDPEGVVSEFPSWVFLPLFLAATLVALFYSRRVRTRLGISG